MREHLILCGLSDAQRKAFKGGRELHLKGPKKNIHQHIESMRKRLVGIEPKRLTDLLDVASYVFAADRTTSRGSAIFANMGKEWRRPFHLVIAVREPAFWSSQPVRQALIGVLEFLSEDGWKFEFVDLVGPTPLQDYFNLTEREADADGGSSIVLFSGGLDSLAGAVHDLRTTNRHVVLVSHRNVPVMGLRQRELADALHKAYPRRVSHVVVDHHLTSLGDRDQAQRTRSFFFTAMATLAAHLERSNRICFYENGIMSINLPISAQVVGTKASRSTHPRSLQLLEELVCLVTEQKATVSNPFTWMTKAEVVNNLQLTAQRDLIRRTISCSRTRGLDAMHPHCGVCAQCLQRRISTLGGNARDADPSEGYESDFMLGAREAGPTRAMAVDTVRSAIGLTGLSDAGFMNTYAGEFSRVMYAFPNSEAEIVAKKFISLFRKHGALMHAVIAIALKDNAHDIAAGRLSADSLIALFLNRLATGSRRSEVIAEVTPLPLEIAEPAEKAPRQPSEIVIAIDPIKKWVIIDGIGTLEGSAIFPIMELLIAMYRQDREQELRPENYQCRLAKQLADKLVGSDEESIRSAILRARKQTIADFKSLFDLDLDINALIENRQRKGYRLNPNVRLVSPAEVKTK